MHLHNLALIVKAGSVLINKVREIRECFELLQNYIIIKTSQGRE